MSRDEFISRFIDQFAGMLLDASVERQGTERSIWTRMAYQKLKANLGAAYDALRPPVPTEPKPTPANGQNPQQVKKNV